MWIAAQHETSSNWHQKTNEKKNCGTSTPGLMDHEGAMYSVHIHTITVSRRCHCSSHNINTNSFGSCSIIIESEWPNANALHELYGIYSMRPSAQPRHQRATVRQLIRNGINRTAHNAFHFGMDLWSWVEWWRWTLVGVRCQCTLSRGKWRSACVCVTMENKML